ncbi:type I secretion system permease/ATPase [Legionella taurinensis]|uniref:Type I secretion system permease/ATPase n=1 Tax=Legionella taurinensis TaxID=70611 RepID=A0A3A5L669_9GAMM|nr:type I secretion system permease/ATPase [Legionella taurinensis]MDX1836858.1 type I secretion system permease/ATPase [Legionella taurinensis]PUT41273.1 type I secretion system permease/ATPase [Legionella taurinensis]PUT42398.1 type I secretion system permease/ATPase [Legionella taurinensis]PUT43924.1 type I secretion system permease/ATPase [Legionella taurinensis]PUT47179.1 type I secretion system permease/ATPase [Legionella taurinensis]
MPTFRQQSWSTIDFESLPSQDSLLACLVLITRYYQNPYSAQSLTARLPLKKGRLDVNLLPRAAERASLSSKALHRGINDFNQDSLPVILLLDNEKACLLIQDEEGRQKIINPASPHLLAEPETIANEYSGQAIHLQPRYKYTTRSEETLGKPPKNWFWKVIIKSIPTYSEVLVASLLINLFALVIPLFTMNVYDRVVPNNAIETMWVLASGVALVFVFDLIFKTLRAYFLDLASKRTDEELSASIFEQILGINMMTRPKSVGALANTVQSFEVFRDFITSSTITVLIDLPFSLLYILVIYFIAGNLFLVPLLIIPLILSIGVVLQWPLIKLTRQSYQFAAEKQATLFESLSNIEAIKTTGAESVLQSRWEQLIHLAAKNGIKLRMVSNSSINLSLFAQQAATIIVIIAGVYAISEGELTTGALIACTILTGRALGPMPQLASLLTRYYQSVNALKSLNRIMQLPVDAEETVRYLNRPVLQGDIEFKQVSFSYDDTNAVLKRINFKITPGERVAIIGRVGSGKSTLARLILKLYLPTEGTILLDGTDYRQINPDDLRQQIGYVPQDVSLFYGSVRENIIIGAPFIDDAALIQAANIAGVGAFTNKHPNGFDRQVGEKGSELSGGQRQAVAIARALLRDPNILLLDEPTSAMDDNSERRLKKALDNHLSKNHTLLLVTHKLSMLELVDRLIVLDDGFLIADGPKESVLAALKAGMPIDKGSQ